MGFGKYLLSRKFLINFGIAILAAIVIVTGTLLALKVFTRHGQAFSVPDYTGVPIDSISAYDPGHNYEYLLIDSVYQKDAKPGSIILQNPAPGALVKEGRKIYLTIVAKMPEKVAMPDLLDLSLRQALGRLKANGLQPGTLTYAPSFDRNAVLAQLFKGDTIQADSLILKGSTIDLILGLGYGEKDALVPFLIGKKPYEAREIILRSGFNTGKEIYLDTENQSEVRVYKQSPEWVEGVAATPGTNIHLYYRSVFEVDFDSLINSFYADTLMIDSTAIELPIDE